MVKMASQQLKERSQNRYMWSSSQRLPVCPVFGGTGIDSESEPDSVLKTLLMVAVKKEEAFPMTTRGRGCGEQGSKFTTPQVCHEPPPQSWWGDGEHPCTPPLCKMASSSPRV